MSRWPSTLLLLFSFTFAGYGQGPPHPKAHPPQGPAPLLYARFVGPAGVRVTLFSRPGAVLDFPAPVTVGLRPGYIYRVRTTGFPGYAALNLFPSIEVRGTLQLPPDLRAADHPVPIVITQDDLERVLAGSLVTKVIYLEHPERALAVSTLPDQPLETDLRASLDPIAEARVLGRPLAIVRLGGRSFSPDELAAQGIGGTILLPGETALPPPAGPPQLQCPPSPVFDPYSGPRHAEEECLRDGGDAGPPVGLDREGRVHGLDPADTAAVYSDSRGGRHIAVSNPVCLCVPRFGVLRTVTLPIVYNAALGVGAAQSALVQSLLQARVPSLETRQNLQAEAILGRQRLSEIESELGTVNVTQFEGTTVIIGRQKEHMFVGTVVEKPVQGPERPLLLRKSVDRESARIGEVVTFTLRYTNQGEQPITDVVVLDSLTGRLEYVTGSEKSDRDAVFTMQPNEAGSLVLRWQISGRLLPGQTGTVTFQAHVR